MGSILLTHRRKMQRYVQDSFTNQFPKSVDIEWLENHVGKLNYGYDPSLSFILNKSFKDIQKEQQQNLHSSFMMLSCGLVGGGSRIVDFIPLIETLSHSASKQSEELRIFPHLAFVLLKKLDLSDKLKIKIQESMAEELLQYYLGTSLLNHLEKNKHLPLSSTYLQALAYKQGAFYRLGAKVATCLGTVSKKQQRVLVDFAESIGTSIELSSGSKDHRKKAKEIILDSWQKVDGCFEPSESKKKMYSFVEFVMRGKQDVISRFSQ